MFIYSILNYMHYFRIRIIRSLKDVYKRQVRLSAAFIELYSQEGAVGFYEKEGYEKSGDEEFQEGVKHFKMIKDLSKPYRRCKGCSA